MANTENLHQWEKLYLEVSFHIDKYLRAKYKTPFIESYYGPTQFKEMMDRQPRLPLSVLTSNCKELVNLVQNSGLEKTRSIYLLKHITAMQTSIDVLSGLQLDYLEEINHIFDIAPEMVEDSAFEEATEELNKILPQKQLLTHRKAQSIPNEKLLSVANLIMSNLQSRIRERIELPLTETFQIKGVNNKPWGAYNWYLGEYSSRVELNLDNRFHLFSLLYLIAHEGYTGHHLEHCLKEKILYKQQGYIEDCLLLTRVPGSVISEGIAEIGIHVLFQGKELFEWVADKIAPWLGLSIDPELEYQLYKAGKIFRYLRDNCAIWIHVKHKTVEEVASYIVKYLPLTHEEAKKTLAFITHPYWKIYAFNYGEGFKLMRNYLGDPPNFQKFLRVLTNQTLPSQLRSEL